MSFVKLPLKAVINYYASQGFDLAELFEATGISRVLQAGGFIGGGFARNLLTKRGILEYLSKSPADTAQARGDIDIFFPNRKAYDSAVKFYESMAVNQKTAKYDHDLYNVKPDHQQPYLLVDNNCSVTGFCHNVTFITSRRPKGWVDYMSPQPRVKIQLVGEFLGDINSITSTYDFTNVKAFITKDNVVYDERIIDLEDKGLLEIVHTSSPLLAARIYKYTRFRGIRALTPNSSGEFTKWLCRARADAWENHPLIRTTDKFFGSSVLKNTAPMIPELIRRKDLFETSALSVVMGQFIDRRVINFGSRYMPRRYKNIDLALEEYNRRMEK